MYARAAQVMLAVYSDEGSARTHARGRHLCARIASLGRDVNPDYSAGAELQSPVAEEYTVRFESLSGSVEAQWSGDRT